MEGPDGTGKSNIAEALADKYKMKVYKNDAEFRLYNEDGGSGDLLVGFH